MLLKLLAHLRRNDSSLTLNKVAHFARNTVGNIKLKSSKSTSF